METVLPKVWLNEFRRYIFALLSFLDGGADAKIRTEMVSEKHMAVWVRAFCHESFKRRLSYETLETAGDTVANYAFKQYLLIKDPKSTPQVLSNMTQYYMSNAAQPEIAASFKMTAWVLQDKSLEVPGSVRVAKSIEEDVFEAFCGALDVVSQRAQQHFADLGDLKSALGCQVGKAATLLMRFYFDAHPMDMSKRFGVKSQSILLEYARTFTGDAEAITIGYDNITLSPQFLQVVESYNPAVANYLRTTSFRGGPADQLGALILDAFDKNGMGPEWRQQIADESSFNRNPRVEAIRVASGYGRFFVRYGKTSSPDRLYGTLLGNYSSAAVNREDNLFTAEGETHGEIYSKLVNWILTNGSSLRAGSK